MKTTFGNGVVVTAAWLNGAKRIFFDGQDLDWHFEPLGTESLILRGPNGLDSRYITLNTDQPTLSPLGVFLSGAPISGNKVTTGKWSFGFNEEQNPGQELNLENSPVSYVTNKKYNFANGVPSPSAYQKFIALAPEDLVTKQIVFDQFDNFVVDNGTY